jgi:aspartyl protease family protein
LSNWRCWELGFIRIKLGIFNPMTPQHLIEQEGIVDTGAIYSVVPRRILEELGVKPVERRRFKAFGGYVERDLGEVGIELMGRRRTITVIFGETDDATVLGVTALELFGLEVDPVRGTLKEAELLMLTFQPLIVTPLNQ